MADSFDADMYDDNMPMPDTAEATNSSSADASVTSPQPRPEALHISGVDSLSTRDVGDWVAFFDDTAFPKIEWIDDHSLNLTMKSPEAATELLRKLIDGDASTVTTTMAVQAKVHPEKPTIHLSVRLATTADVKPPRAAERSRWYLMHPEDERKNVYARARANVRSSGARTSPYNARNSRRRRERPASPDNRPLADRLSLPLDPSEGDLLHLTRARKETAESASGDPMAVRMAEAAAASERRTRPTRNSEGSGRATLRKDDLLAGRQAETGGRRLTLAERLHGRGGEVDLLTRKTGERDLLDKRRPKGLQIRGISGQ